MNTLYTVQHFAVPTLLSSHIRHVGIVDNKELLSRWNKHQWYAVHIAFH
jgi:hypothetical protein